MAVKSNMQYPIPTSRHNNKNKTCTENGALESISVQSPNLSSLRQVDLPKIPAPPQVSPSAPLKGAHNNLPLSRKGD